MELTRQGTAFGSEPNFSFPYSFFCFWLSGRCAVCMCYPESVIDTKMEGKKAIKERRQKKKQRALLFCC